MSEIKTCETCRFWKQGIGVRFGECHQPNTYSWVRGQSFEPPDYFGCINHETKTKFITTDEFKKRFLGIND